MKRVRILSNARFDTDQLGRSLGGLFEFQVLRTERMASVAPEMYTVIDVDLKASARLLDIKAWLEKKPKDARVVFVTDKSSRVEVMRAYTLGATDVMPRPLDPDALLAIFSRDLLPLALSPPIAPDDGTRGIATASHALHDLFSTASLGAPVDPAAINTAGEVIVSEIETNGLASWIDKVRKHHSQTYQHCLLVTGLAVGFGQHLGVSTIDRQRLSFAGMMHDVGKAHIPIAILEKPGPLDQNEIALMRQHPTLGLDALRSTTDVQAEMIDAVAQHHELLDGSGYPHGLQGQQIPDLVRILTICDIFGALIERRSYKPPMPGEDAYEVLIGMGPKLDKALVREFRFAAQLGRRS